ncbi:hypothetical protein J6590_048686 [Homalodisca vitripennis]|nr:hypothetical protein J6590_048686 [Homalodisca vitripennis]
MSCKLWLNAKECLFTENNETIVNACKEEQACHNDEVRSPRRVKCNGYNMPVVVLPGSAIFRK